MTPKNRETVILLLLVAGILVTTFLMTHYELWSAHDLLLQR